MASRKFSQRYITGYTSQRGDKFVRVENKKLFAYIPLMTFTVDEARAKRVLARAGISMPGGAWRELLDDVAALTDFPDRMIADRFGWNGGAFLFADGELVAPGDGVEPAVAINSESDRCELNGSLEGWIKQVAKPLARQSLPMAAVLMAFAAPLVELISRHENFGFELVGPGGKGKSLTQRLAASVLRSTDLTSFNTTMAGLEIEMEACNGQLLILDEANSFYGERTKGGAGTAMKSVAFRMAGGKATQRYQSERPQRYYYVFLTSSNQPLASIAGAEHKDSLAAASDRLMTLNISASRAHGVFDRVPKRFSSAEAYAKALGAGAAANHGYPMRAYIRELVDLVAADRAGLVAAIQADISYWRERAGVGLGDDGAQGRVADAFGLLYAAGQIAQSCGVLPESWKCGAALVGVYRNFYVGLKPPIPIDAALRALIAKERIRDLDKHGLRELSDRRFNRTTGFTKRKRDGSTELRMPPAQQAEHLPDLPARIAGSKAGIRMLSENGHNTVKRQVRAGTRDRVVVLKLPPDFS